MTPDWFSLIVTGSAASALLWFVKLFVDGKVHNGSEVEGLRQDKKDLFAVNQNLSEALDTSNRLLEETLRQRKS